MKKILIIGSGESNATIVREAKKMGLYTIVVDGHKLSKLTPAKELADEHWEIDYSLTDEICDKAKATNINGVIAGYSEYRVLASMKIANKLGLPCYTNRETFDVTRDKSKFKNACKKNGLLTPEFCTITPNSTIDDLKLEFPVIVKPVDGVGRKGLSVCNNKEELSLAVEKAFNNSIDKMAIIERYINGLEFSAKYTIYNGDIRLAIMKDKYKVKEVENYCLCNFNIAPSINLDRYMSETDEKVKKMFRSLNINNGVITMQGTASKEGFYFFESNYRLGGGNDNYTIEKENKSNYVRAAISYAIGENKYSNELDNPYFKHYCASLWLYAKEGTIAKIEYPKKEDIKQIKEILEHRKVGEEITNDGTTEKRILSFFIVADSIDEIKVTVNKIQEKTKIEDTKHNNMLYEKFDVKEVVLK